MFLFKPARWLAIVPALTAVTVYAQAVVPPSGPSSAPSTASPPAYKSALEGYQPYRDEKIQPWKESNDTVGKVGGWRAYAKEAAEPASQGGSAPAAPSAPNPHAGHGKP